MSAVLASKFHVSHWHSRIFDRHLEELHQLASGITTCWFCFNAAPLHVQDRKMPRLTPCTRHPRTKHTWRTFLEVMNNLHLQDTPTQSATQSATQGIDSRRILQELTGQSLSIRLSTARDTQKLPRQSPLAPCVAKAASTAAFFLFQSSLRCNWEGRISQSFLADLIVRWVVLLGNLGTVSLEYVGTMCHEFLDSKICWKPIEVKLQQCGTILLQWLTHCF